MRIASDGADVDRIVIEISVASNGNGYEKEKVAINSKVHQCRLAGTIGINRGARNYTIYTSW